MFLEFVVIFSVLLFGFIVGGSVLLGLVLLAEKINDSPIFLFFFLTAMFSALLALAAVVEQRL